MENPDVLPVAGRLTIHAAAEQHALLVSGLAAGATTLDLSAVEEIDSAGVQLLLACRRSLAARGKALALRATPAAVGEVLERYALQPLLPTRAD